MKLWFSNLFSGKKTAWPVVWDDTFPSAYQQLLPWRGEPGPLPENLRRLPDTLPRKENEISWSDGALDGVFSHHMAGGDETDVQKIRDLLKAAAEKGDKASVSAFLAAVREESPLGYIDPLLQLIVEQQGIDADKLADFSAWLAQNSPERNVIKLAMSVLAFFPGQENSDILFVLAAHDEFTLYGIVAQAAMTKTPQEYEALWWRMARRVDGWGRVHMIERIPENPGKPLRQWLLRDGYNNAVMNEYTAWYCATQGRLAEALTEPADAELLHGATEILQALFNGGPAQDISDYDDRAQCCLRYLNQLAHTEPALEHYSLVWSVNDYLSDNPAQFGNTEILKGLAAELLASPRIAQLVSEQIRSTDEQTRYQAIRAGRLFRIDIWPELFVQQQQNAGNDDWLTLMQTDDPERARQVAELAEQQLPLVAIASGPSDAMGLGPDWEPHSKLDSVLQELHRFPDIGWPLIRCGLQSPVVRNRNKALNALYARARESWPQDVTGLLEKGVQAEPDNQVKARMTALLKGEKDPADRD